MSVANQSESRADRKEQVGRVTGRMGAH